ncbi:MAG TPA: Trk system potassium transporter TrkA [Candidatus Omnitrophota bacterium]|nr:Trk system potassium transporter TrkA [Candidatus Omnitrophota bacterium]HPN56445.1 Trk system potassium transporter TrkA [Candidatus Omnitrophota bacterium]
MKIIVVGAGEIGSNLARFLTEENHEVFLIEQNEETVRKIQEKMDVKIVTGSGADPEILKQVLTGGADLVVAVTTSDEVNLTVCVLASSLGAKRRIARVRNSSLSKELLRSGLSLFHLDEIINPEEVASRSIVRTIETPGAREVADFVDGRILLRAFELPESSPLCNIKLEEVNPNDFPWPFLIVFVIRDGTVIIPKGANTLKVGDRIYVLLPAGSLGEFLTFVDPTIRKPKKAVIYGASDIGIRVAQGLTPIIRDIVLLDENGALAENAASLLEETQIINGSAAEPDMLKEAGIEAADVFVAASSQDHSNLISSVLAKRMGAKTTIIVSQQPAYLSIIDALNIDVIITPRLLAVQQILRFVRGKGVRSMIKLLDCKAEVLEFVPDAGSPVTRALIKNISFPKNSIVGAITVGGEAFLANGETQIKAGERVIVFCQDNAVQKLTKLFVKQKA